MSERKVKVTVRAGCVLYHDGTSYGPGQVVALSADHAKALVEQGVVER